MRQRNDRPVAMVSEIFRAFTQIPNEKLTVRAEGFGPEYILA
ncbi:hypothetical protein WG908_13955 [Sphingobium sp. AN641]